jgi:uncharacterized membrane protein HdeD (DUF308 family)
MSSSRQPSEWESAVEGAARGWWLGLVAGLLAIAGGIVLIAYPGPTLEVIALLVGIELVIASIFLFVAAFGERSGARTAGIVAGALALIAGVIIVRHPGGSVLVVALAVGIYLILAGVLRLAGAVEASGGRGWQLLAAVIDIGLGVMIVAWPQFGITSLAIVLGIVLIVRGVALVVIAFAARAIGRELSQPAAPAL